MRTVYPTHSQLYLWPGRALYCGPIQHLETHVYGADVLHVGLYGPFRIRIEGRDWLSTPCAIVPAGIRHALDLAGGVYGKLFVERNMAWMQGARRRFGYRQTTPRFFEDMVAIECFRRIYEEDHDRHAAAEQVNRLLQNAEPPQFTPDARIRRVVERIGREPDRNFSQDELAAGIGLSPSRFLHLYREQTGLPYRRFRQWKRMMSAFCLLHSTDSLTRAALDADYADASHFSRSFRATFGVNPAPVFRNLGRFEVGP